MAVSGFQLNPFERVLLRVALVLAGVLVIVRVGAVIAVLVIEAGVGLWGFVLHTMGNLQGPSVHPFDNFIYGAPPMAPLLFPNLMVLGIIGLWQLRNSEDFRLPSRSTISV